MGVGRIGVGAVAGPQLPVAQDDASLGTILGLRARVGVLPMLAAEGTISWLINGDGESASGLTMESPSALNYQLHALVRTPGLGLFWYLSGGVGLSSLDVPGSLGSQNEFSTSFGVGAELEWGSLAFDLSPRLFVVRTEDGASRKNLGVLVGTTWYFD
jgi:hypothetical protein